MYMCVHIITVNLFLPSLLELQESFAIGLIAFSMIEGILVLS